jgi:hypothetical protein
MKYNQLLSLPSWEGHPGLFVVRHNSFFEPLPVLQDHVVNDLPTENTSPPKKTFLLAEELFISHGSATAIAVHIGNPTMKFEKSLSREIYQVNKNLK